MKRLPLSLARVSNTEPFFADPLTFLAQTRSQCGDVVVIRERGPILSRDSECNGVVAVFGEENVRQILTAIEDFGSPMSAATKMELPANLVNLNRSLHSMHGSEHARHKHFVARILNHEILARHQHQIRASLDRFCEAISGENKISVVSQMRKLAMEMASSLLLGEQSRDDDELTYLLNTYFNLRRDAASLNSHDALLNRDVLVSAGQRLDRLLRDRIRRFRKNQCDKSGGLLQRLATAGMPGAPEFSENAIVGHANIIFVSSMEPVAITLTWALLVLSQLPELRRVLRAEITGREASAAHDRRDMLDNVISETLRLLTPNALMVRLTTRALSLQGITLPARCEIVLCPFLAHREAQVFADPNVFLPARWNKASPSPFEYFPFGAGGHFCAGRNLALSLIREALATLVVQFDFVLSSEQSIDWCIRIMLMPKNDPTLQAHRVTDDLNVSSPKWGGPVSDLFHFAPGLA